MLHTFAFDFCDPLIGDLLALTALLLFLIPTSTASRIIITT